MSRTGFFVTVMAAAAATLLFTSLKLPLWHLRMEAPQYQGSEALHVHVFPGSLKGDLREIKVLNHYIGVHIPERLPQSAWLPITLIAGATLGLIAAFLPRGARSWALSAVALGLCLSLGFAAAQAQWQMHRIGHQRDQHTPLKGIADFTPPLLGRVKIANFTLTATLGSGALLIAAGIGLEMAAAVASKQSKKAARQDVSTESQTALHAHPLATT